MPPGAPGYDDRGRHSGTGRSPRLQGCTPAWMQVVEPRLEQAAEEGAAGIIISRPAFPGSRRPPWAGLGEENPVFCKIETRRDARLGADHGFF